MRMLTTAFVVAMATTPAMAMDLPMTGLSLNTDIEALHKFDAESTTVKITPELEYETGRMSFMAGTTLDIWDDTNQFTLDDEFDTLPTIDFEATFALRDNVDFEVGTSYDLEAEERGEITAGLTFSF